MAYYSIRDLIGHFVAPAQCGTRCARTPAAATSGSTRPTCEVILPNELLRRASDEDLAAHYDRMSRGHTAKDERARAQVYTSWTGTTGSRPSASSAASTSACTCRSGPSLPRPPGRRLPRSLSRTPRAFQPGMASQTRRSASDRSPATTMPNIMLRRMVSVSLLTVRN